MKKLFSLGFVLFSLSTFAQPNTEVYLADINTIDGKMEFSNLRNISNNEGYDNQPSFYDDNTVLFSSTRNGQTDIAKFDIPSGKSSWLTDTPGGSEYSPLRIPKSADVSAIRLDTSGLQRLYRYDISSGNSNVLLKDLKVGYHVWQNDEIIFSSILAENRMDLLMADLREAVDIIITKNVGRSLHKIPNSELVGFITKDGENRTLKALDPMRGTAEIILSLPSGTEDICWLPDGRLIFPNGKSIIGVNPKTEERPKTIHLFQEKEINNISRMAVSSDGKYLAIVSEESPAKIVQKQVDSYNTGNLDAFVNCYSENVVVRNFPNDTLYVGQEKMRKNYGNLSPDKKVYDVEVVKRIVIGNKVIDQEKVTGNGKISMQVALYEVNNGKISSMTFIFDDATALDPKTIVQKQMDSYNARDIEAFLDTYAEDIKVFNFPNEARYVGKEKMRERYTSFFESTPDLNYIVKNRMVIDNKVIDEEFVTAKGNNFGVVAIYEVENDKIAKITFLR